MVISDHDIPAPEHRIVLDDAEGFVSLGSLGGESTFKDGHYAFISMADDLLCRLSKHSVEMVCKKSTLTTSEVSDINSTRE